MNPFHVPARRFGPRLLLPLALCLWQAGANASDIFGYVDANGVAHFALRQSDPRYQPFLRGGKNLDGANGMRPMGRDGKGALDGMRAMERGARDLATDDKAARTSQTLVRLFEASPAFRPAKTALHQAARQHAIDYELLQALIATESGFNTLAVSPKGAIGLMQLMPETAQRYGVAADGRRTLENKLHDPIINIATGARHLRNLIAMFSGDLHLALAAYNAGEGAVQRAGNRIPDYRETQNYVKTVLQIYAQLKLPTAGGGIGGNFIDRASGRVRVELAAPKGGALGRGNLPSSQRLARAQGAPALQDAPAEDAAATLSPTSFEPTESAAAASAASRAAEH